MELKLFVATKAFIERDGKILIIRESNKYQDGTNIGKWALPGGRLTPGEHLEDALRREIKEETGLEVSVGAPFFGDETLPRPQVRGEEWQIIKLYFSCPSEAGEVSLSEDHDAYQWIEAEKYKTVGLIENMYPAFEAYLKLPR